MISRTTLDVMDAGETPEVNSLGGQNLFSQRQDLNRDLECLNESSIMEDLGYCDELVEGEQWLVSVNVRSILANKVKLEELITSQKPQMIALQEVWQPNHVHLSFKDYCFEYETRLSRRGGGVGVLVSNSLSYTKRKDLSVMSNDCEIVTIDTSKYLVMSVYMPPDANFQMAITELENLLTQCKSKPLYLCGDFNIDFSKDTFKTIRFNDLMMSMELVPLIKNPTRITITSKTVIDNIFTNRKGGIKCGVLMCDISDHLAPFVSLKKEKIPSLKKTAANRRLTGPKNMEALRTALKDMHWQIDDDDPVATFQDFFLKLENAFKSSCPISRLESSNFNKKHNPWMSQGLLNSRHHKQKLCNRLNKNPTE